MDRQTDLLWQHLNQPRWGLPEVVLYQLLPLRCLRRARVLLMTLFLLCCTPAVSLQAQHSSLFGYSGLMLVPSAEVMEDGQIRFGVSRLPMLYTSQEWRFPDWTIYFFGLGYMPFLEGAAMIVRPDNYPGGVGDRSVAFKVRLIRQRGKWPALAIGAQDFFGIKKINLEPSKAQKFAALYAVSSKSLRLKNMVVALHLGYGVDWLPAQSHQLDGL
ncbi:MAG: YjbH domain-containing protein, partial [Anaerolineales bacterium]|nr:YjbH domain-containing protein [Anaerolineales bacterium]